MSAESNIAVVQNLFTAFGRGDLDTVLAAHAADVDSQAPVSRTECDLPWAGPRRGRRAVADFFDQLGSTLRPEPFEDLVFTAADDRVVVEGHNKGIVLSTGKAYEHDWVMIFTIRDGEIARFRHYYDPADIESALGD